MGDLADQAIVLVEDAEKTSQDEQAPRSGEYNQDLKQLQDLYDLMRVEGLEDLELDEGDIKIQLHRARRSNPSHDAHGHRLATHLPHPAAPEPAPDAEIPSNTPVILTPLAGVFYRSSSPTNPPYVQEGSVVEPGQTLCIVEAMKVMNEIKAESRCRITKILAENSRPVTAGQTLFQIEPA